MHGPLLLSFPHGEVDTQYLGGPDDARHRVAIRASWGTLGDSQ